MDTATNATKASGGPKPDESRSLLSPFDQEGQLQQQDSQPNFFRSRWVMAALIVTTGVFSAIIVVLLTVLFACMMRPTNGTSIPSASSGIEYERPISKLEKPLVILISSDGFRWGYQWKVPTPNMDRLRKNGTEAFPGMIPVYPSVTFPNHYSIATGLYPAWHGIIANSFRDPDPSSNDKFHMGNNDPKWWLGEPIWETVVKNGLPAAVFFWPGSEVIKGAWTCPQEFCMKYNESVPFETRVDTVLNWVDLPTSERPSFIGLYFEEPDEEGHKFGPDSPQIDAAIKKVDTMVGRLLDGLQSRGVVDEMTIIMVGDHGMVGTCDQKLIYLDDLAPWVQLENDWIQSTSPVLAITPPVNGPNASFIVSKINEGLASGKVNNGEFLKVYLKEDLPKRLHYSDSDRIEPIIGMVSESYKVEKKKSSRKECGGAHGYDNEYASMRTIFLGHGPHFGKNRQVPSFINVEVYDIIASVLGIKGAPTNGTQGFLSSILLPKQP